jgi:hypothetical protein
MFAEFYPDVISSPLRNFGQKSNLARSLLPWLIAIAVAGRSRRLLVSRNHETSFIDACIFVTGFGAWNCVG